MSLLVKYRHVFGAVAILIVVLLGGLVREPVFQGSLVSEMSPELPELIAAQTIRDARGGRETSVVMIRPAAGASIGETFDGLEQLHAGLLRIDDTEVRSILTTRNLLFAYGVTEDDPIGELINAIRPAPMYEFLVSQSEELFVDLVVTPRSAQEQIYGVVAAMPAASAFDEVRVLAGTRLDDDVADSLREDLRILIPTILLASLVVLYVGFGHWRALVLPAFASVSSTVVVLTVLSAAGITINLVTLLALPIVLIVSIANSCHFLAKSIAVSNSSHEIDAAILATLQRVALPYFLSSLTTAIALASLIIGDVDPIADLGFVAATSLMVSFGLIVLVAPAAIGFYLRRPAITLATNAGYLRASGGLARRRKEVAIVLLLLAAFGLASVPRLTFHSDPRSFFPDTTEFTRTFREFEASFYSFAPLRVLITPKEQGPSSFPPIEMFAETRRLREAFAGFPGVRGMNVSSPRGAEDSLMFTALVSTDEDLDAIDAFLQKHVETVPDVYDVIYSSGALVYTRIDRRALDSLLESLAWSVLLILLILAVVFRSTRALAAALAANIVPLAVVLGAALVLGASFNLVTAFVFLVVLGIVVDDTIHILHWARSGDRIGGSSIEFSVIWSTVLLCLGLLLCQMSDFPTTRDFGVYCALALVGAVVSDLTILPLVLRWKKSDVEVGDG